MNARIYSKRPILENQWLYPLFNENASEVTVEGIFEYSERVDQIQKLFDLLRPQLQDINANHCIDVLSPYLAEEEKYDVEFFL